MSKLRKKKDEDPIRDEFDAIREKNIAQVQAILKELDATEDRNESTLEPEAKKRKKTRKQKKKIVPKEVNSKKYDTRSSRQKDNYKRKVVIDESSSDEVEEKMSVSSSKYKTRSRTKPKTLSKNSEVLDTLKEKSLENEVLFKCSSKSTKNPRELISDDEDEELYTPQPHLNEKTKQKRVRCVSKVLYSNDDDYSDENIEKE